MALTTCGECKAEISDKAAACPKCGAPQRGALTIQATAKRYKGMQLLGAAVMSVGVVMIVVQNHLSGALVMLAGLGLFVGARMAAWWRHG